MDEHEPPQISRSRLKRRSSSKTLLITLVLIIAAGGLAFWYLKDPHLSLESLLHTKKGPGTETVAEKTTVNETTGLHNSTNNQGAIKDETSTVKVDQTTEIKDTQNSLKNDGQQADGDCKTECGRIEKFFSHLDKQPYIRAYKLPQPSKEYFTQLIIKLAQNPPIITRETDDLFTILKNTAHFFRVIGKQNILILKGILDQEKDSFEEILAVFYALSNEPECLNTGLALDIPGKALYKYAGFFLNTMGGRLYLFRRNSMSRLPVSYYSILLIDRANREGTNSDGIDIRPAISALIDELENTGNQLKMKETYLDELYALKEKYPQEPAK